MPRAKSVKNVRESASSVLRKSRQSQREAKVDDINDTIASTQYTPPPSTAYCLRLAIDIGTITSTVAYQVCATKDDLPPIYIARLHEMELESSMIVRYDDQGGFHEGQDLLNQLNQGLLGEDDCLRFAKLALQPNKATAAIHNKVIAHTTRVGKKPQDIFVDYVDAIVKKAKAYIKGTSYGNIDGIPLELFISTPQIWAPCTNLAMIDAGKRIATKCAIVPEPLCAAACLLHDEINAGYQSQTNVALAVDDLVLVADLGGGTADMVLFRLCSAPMDGPNFALEVVRPATGNLAGASQINRNFEKWLKEIHLKKNTKAFDNIASELGFERSEFSARASAAFETCKVEFPRSAVYNVVVNGRQGAVRPAWVCVLQRDDIESMFQPVVNDIVNLVYDTLAGIENPNEPVNLKAVILCGGLGSSSHIRSALKENFGAINILHPRDEYKAPVAKGALLRYTMPTLQRPLGYGWSLCCIRNEIWDPTLHKDATIGKRNPKPDKRVAKADPHDKKAWEVEDRCAYILDGVRNVTQQKWSIHHPPITDLPIVITAEVYFTIKPDISEHEPLYVKGTRNVRDCFTKFCDIRKVISDPAAANIGQIKQKNGEMTWDIVSCVVIKRSADSIELGIHIRDEAEMYDANGRFIEACAIPEHEWTDMQEIWSAQFSHLSMEVASSTPAPVDIANAVQHAEDTVEDDELLEPMFMKAEPDSDDDDLSDLYEFVE